MLTRFKSSLDATAQSRNCTLLVKRGLLQLTQPMCGGCMQVMQSFRAHKQCCEIVFS